MYLVYKFVGILPEGLRPYAKAVIPAFAAAVTVVTTFITTGNFDSDGLEIAGGMAGAAILTLVFPNQGK